MTAKSRRGVFAVLAAVGILGALAIGVSSAGAQAGSVPANSVAFRAFVDNGFQAALNGVGGASVVLTCSSQEGFLNLVGNQSNGIAKANFNDEDNNERTESADDFDNTDLLPLNDDYVGLEVIGHAEFVNGNANWTMTVNYQTEDQTPLGNTNADCMAEGSVIKGNSF